MKALKGLFSTQKDEQSLSESEKKEKKFREQPLPSGLKRLPIEQQSKEFKEVSTLLSKTMKIEVIGGIGGGNYSNVYFGLNYEYLKQNAIKVIDLKKASNNYRLKFLRKEINVMQKVKHQNIIKIYECIQTDNKVIIVMEFATMGTLANYIRTNGAFNEKDGQQVFKSIVEGLRYMHSLNFAHRDMKADNVLLCKHFVPKLSDFSHSRQLELESDMSGVKLSQTFCGSIPYFPPQILELKAYNAFKYDIWSTGVVLYLILFAEFPFDAENEKKMLSNQMNRKYYTNISNKTKISNSCKDLINKMLEPNEEKRITTTALYLHPWVRNTKPMVKPEVQKT